MPNYTNSRGLAITAGVAATGGAIALLLSEPLNTGHWTLDHGLTPLIVGLTVASGHLTATALRACKPLTSIGFAVAFMIGTGVTVLNGVGRQTEGAEAKQAEIAKTNDAVTSKQAELTKARTRLDQANQMAEREMTGQRCGVRCSDWKQRAAEVGSHIKTLEADLAKLGTVKPVNPKAAKVGEIAAVFGANPAKAQATVALVEPLLVPFLLEWLAIVALGYGFGHSNLATVATVAAVAEIADEHGATDGNPQPPKPGCRRPVVVNRVATRAAAEADIIRLVARGETLPSQDALSARWRVHKGTTSKWLADFERRGLIARQWDGRHKQVAAA